MVAQSKQITADLMALRAEVKRTDERGIRRVMDRAFLTIEQCRSLSSDLHDLWMEGHEFNQRTRERKDLALTSGQLTLGTGGR